MLGSLTSLRSRVLNRLIQGGRVRAFPAEPFCGPEAFRLGRLESTIVVLDEILERLANENGLKR